MIWSFNKWLTSILFKVIDFHILLLVSWLLVLTNFSRFLGNDDIANFFSRAQAIEKKKTTDNKNKTKLA